MIDNVAINLAKPEVENQNGVKRTNNTIVWTHVDGDALGCVAVLELAVKPLKYFHSNYHDVDKALNEIKNAINETKISEIIICDLSFTEHRNALEELDAIARNNGITVKYFDHHLYPENFFEGLNFNVLIDTTKSACKILMDYYKTDSIKDLINILNVYDIWIKDDALFEDSLVFNEYIFKQFYGHNEKILSTARALINADIKSIVDANRAIENNAFNKLVVDLRKDGKYMRSTQGVPMTLLFNWDYFPWFTYYEHRDGQAVVVGIQYGIFKIRVKGGVFTDENLKNVRRELCGSEDYGHSLAFTYKKNVKTNQDVINEVTHIAKVFNKYSGKSYK